MENNILQLTNGEHIFYYSNKEESYVQNAVSYIVSGIEREDHIVFIENNKIFPLVHKKMKTFLTDEQIAKVHYINNFDFYCIHGDFHTPTIVGYFSDILEPYLEANASIRTWAHVEWGNQKEIKSKIAIFEDVANISVNEMGLTSVCAYDASAVSDSLKTKLMTNHEFLMTDDELIPSDLFRKSKTV